MIPAFRWLPKRSILVLAIAIQTPQPGLPVPSSRLMQDPGGVPGWPPPGILGPQGFALAGGYSDPSGGALQQVRGVCAVRGGCGSRARTRPQQQLRLGSVLSDLWHRVALVQGRAKAKSSKQRSAAAQPAPH